MNKQTRKLATNLVKMKMTNKIMLCNKIRIKYMLICSLKPQWRHKMMQTLMNSKINTLIMQLMKNASCKIVKANKKRLILIMTNKITNKNTNTSMITTINKKMRKATPNYCKTLISSFTTLKLPRELSNKNLTKSELKVSN